MDIHDFVCGADMLMIGGKKHVGKPLRKIYQEDPEYVRWYVQDAENPLPAIKRVFERLLNNRGTDYLLYIIAKLHEEIEELKWKVTQLQKAQEESCVDLGKTT